MYNQVADYVRSCNSYQRNKAYNRRPPGRMQPLPIPLRRYETTPIDYIMGLLEYETCKYNSIIVVIDLKKS